MDRRFREWEGRVSLGSVGGKKKIRFSSKKKDGNPGVQIKVRGGAQYGIKGRTCKTGFFPFGSSSRRFRIFKEGKDHRLQRKPKEDRRSARKRGVRESVHPGGGSIISQTKKQDREKKGKAKKKEWPRNRRKRPRPGIKNSARRVKAS